MQNSIRIAVIGAGAFGRNHLRVLSELQHQTSNPEIPHLDPQHPRAKAATPGDEALFSSQLQNSQLKTEPNPSPAQVHLTGGSANPNPSSLDTSPPTAEHQPRPTANVHLVAAVDASPTVRAEVSQRYNIPTFATVDELLGANLNLHAATVAVPTIHHATIATKLLEANLDVLVEKPLTATLAEADALIALAASRHRILAAGHLERFNPSVTAALARLTRPMFFEAHRLSIFTPRSLDVDVVLDLMIHDLDILLTMANASEASNSTLVTESLVTEVRAVGLPVLSPKVDIANVRLEFRSGAIANLTASRVSTEQVRKLRLFQPAQYLSLDYARQELLTINVDPTLAATAALKHSSSQSESEARSGDTPASAPAASTPLPHPSAGLNFEKLNLPRAEPLRLELEDFLTAVQTRTQPRVTGQAARNALALALEINAAIQNHAKRAGLVS